MHKTIQTLASMHISDKYFEMDRHTKEGWYQRSIFFISPELMPEEIDRLKLN